MDEAKNDYDKLKKTMDESRAAEVLSIWNVFIIFSFFATIVISSILLLFIFHRILLMLQVDAEYKLQDMKKLCMEWEMKGKGYQKRLDDIKMDLVKQIEQ